MRQTGGIRALRFPWGGVAILRSDDFRTRWGAHNVRHHGTDAKRCHHQAVGDLTLDHRGAAIREPPLESSPSGASTV